MKTNTETKTQNKYIKSLKAAFPHTVPILAGFLFLGMTYGIYMNVSGFNFVYPMLMSMTIFAGSVEFVTVNLLLGSFDPVQAFVMALMLNARHIFYGISMLDKCATKLFRSITPQTYRKTLTEVGLCFS